MPAPVPLPTLLSQALVAFTIELDNAFEERMPHWTMASLKARQPASGPLLTSFVMWANFLQFVDGDPAVRDVQARARISTKAMHTTLAGMQRWGYVTLRADREDSRRKPPEADLLIGLTGNGRRAQEVWEPLPAEIEARWATRFGGDAIETLRASLLTSNRLPPFSPMVTYPTGLRADVPDEAPRADGAADLGLVTLLAQSLLVLTLDYEERSELSLAISANILRVLDGDGVPVSDVPRRAGVSKEAVNFAVGFLEKRDYVVVEPDPAAARVKNARLTPNGLEAQTRFLQLRADLEDRAARLFGAQNAAQLRTSLESLVGESGLAHSPLARGLEPPPGTWRAAAPPPETLPHHPMVLHRGGYPDGA